MVWKLSQAIKIGLGGMQELSIDNPGEYKKGKMWPEEQQKIIYNLAPCRNYPYPERAEITIQD